MRKNLLSFAIILTTRYYNCTTKHYYTGMAWLGLACISLRITSPSATRCPTRFENGKGNNFNRVCPATRWANLPWTMISVQYSIPLVVLLRRATTFHSYCCHSSTKATLGPLAFTTASLLLLPSCVVPFPEYFKERSGKDKSGKEYPKPTNHLNQNHLLSTHKRRPKAPLSPISPITGNQQSFSLSSETSKVTPSPIAQAACKIWEFREFLKK